jgi:MoaA/NifB/PqqE/SkfB family radical SAM enzyme
MSGSLLKQTLEEFNGPVLASHVVCSEALKPGVPRANSLDRDELEHLRSRQALIGVPFVNDLLAFAGATPEGRYSAGIEDLLRQILGLAEVVGVKQLALGGDFFDFRHYSRRLGLQLGPVAELDTADGISRLRRELANLGLSSGQVRGILRDNAIEFLGPWLSEKARDPEPVLRSPRPMVETPGNRWTFQEPCDVAVFGECRDAEPLSKRLPSHAWLTLSNYCNLSCKHCRRTYGRVTGDTLSRDIPEELFDHIMGDVLPAVQSVILGGNNNSEITKAARFPRIVDWLSQASKRPRRVSLQTNGCAIEDELVEQLVTLDTVFNISVEGGTDETCKRIRGIPLSVLERQIGKINNLRMLGRSRARIVLSFTAMRSNIDELPLLVEFAERCGVDEVNVMYLLPATSEWNCESPLHALKHNNEVLEQTEKLAEAWHVELLAPPIVDMEDERCMRPWYSISVNGNGIARFCCLDGSPEVGDLTKQSLSDLWNSPSAQRARQTVNSDDPPDECGACVLRNLPRVNRQALEKQMA